MGLQEHRHTVLKRSLFEHTLHGAVKMLVELLSLVSPTAFSRALRLKRYVRHVVNELNLPDAWQLELAAMLSQIGCVTLPPELVERAGAGDALTEEEQKLYGTHALIGFGLVANIPRLEQVARMILEQSAERPDPREDAAQVKPEEALPGAKVLRAAVAYDRLLTQGHTQESAIGAMKEPSGGAWPPGSDRAGVHER